MSTQEPTRQGNEEAKAWLDVVNSIADVISASKTMVQIFEKKMQAVKGEEDLPLQEIYRHEDQSRKISRAGTDDSLLKIPSWHPMHHPFGPSRISSIGTDVKYGKHKVLDEQYHLAKKAIARHYRPPYDHEKWSQEPNLTSYYSNLIDNQGWYGKQRSPRNDFDLSNYQIMSAGRRMC